MRGSAAPGPWIHPWICPWPINSYTSLFRGKKYAHFNSTVLLHTYSLQPFLQHVSHKCTYPTNTYPVIPTITCGKPNDVKCWLSTVRNQHFCKQYMGQVLYWVLFVTNELQKHWELFKLSRTSNVHDQYLHAPVIKAIYMHLLSRPFICGPSNRSVKLCMLIILHYTLYICIYYIPV